MWNNTYESWVDANEECCNSKNSPNESFWYNLRKLCVSSAKAKISELRFKVADKVADKVEDILKKYP
jgi:hypothetical protein